MRSGCDEEGELEHVEGAEEADQGSEDPDLAINMWCRIRFRMLWCD